eukprot:scaffold23167_cov63-Phaeocystis_antarctica.AAC.5
MFQLTGISNASVSLHGAKTRTAATATIIRDSKSLVYSPTRLLNNYRRSVGELRQSLTPHIPSVLTPRALAGRARRPPARAPARRRRQRDARPQQGSARQTTSRAGACPRARARRRRARARGDRTTRR